MFLIDYTLKSLPASEKSEISISQVVYSVRDNIFQLWVGRVFWEVVVVVVGGSGGGGGGFIFV